MATTSTANTSLAPIRVRTSNGAAESKGSIHGDETAREIGCRGGFVEAGVHVSSQLSYGRVPAAGEPPRVGGEILRLFERSQDKGATVSVGTATERGETVARIEHISTHQFRPRGAASTS